MVKTYEIRGCKCCKGDSVYMDCVEHTPKSSTILWLFSNVTTDVSVFASVFTPVKSEVETASRENQSVPSVQGGSFHVGYCYLLAFVWEVSDSVHHKNQILCLNLLFKT